MRRLPETYCTLSLDSVAAKAGLPSGFDAELLVLRCALVSSPVQVPGQLHVRLLKQFCTLSLAGLPSGFDAKLLIPRCALV